MSLDVAQLISDLNYDYIDVLGHSMGGKVAMTLALTQVKSINQSKHICIARTNQRRIKIDFLALLIII